MLTETELDDLTNGFLDDMITLKEGDFNGGKTEQVKKLGALAECGKSDCVPCKDVLQD